MQNVFLKIREMIVEFPGATFGIGRLEHVHSGWVVKQLGSQNFEGEEGMIDAFKIALESTKAIQGFKDGDTELWDVIEIFDNEDEATEAGKVNEQMTIYQIETGRLKWLE